MKVLIIYAKAGAGHRRAAEAVFAAFKRKGVEQEVALIDCLDYTNKWFRFFYPQSYMFLVRFLPFLWAALYYSLDNKFFYSLIKPIRRLNNYFATLRLSQFLKQNQPQVIISTQFFASEVAAALKKKGQINSLLISVVTDFGLHTFWESRFVDIFVVASEDTKQDLLTRNIPVEKIMVLGIPIEATLTKLNQPQLKQELGLDRGRFSILIVGGGFGVGPIKKLVFSLEGLSSELKNQIELIVVCSRNKKLYKKIQRIKTGLTLNVKIFGFVPDLYKIMAASSVIISKSGGLTTSEALACALPMVIISPIPGQETKNCDLLVRNGAALKINKAAQLKDLIEELITRPEKLEAMRRQAIALARPNSADDIVSLTNKYLGSKADGKDK